MRIPWVPVDNARIARRHMHSVALAAYLRHCAEQDQQTWRNAGQFFLPPSQGQDSPARRVGKYLTPVPSPVADALHAALPKGVQAEIGVLDGSWVEKLVELLDNVEKQLSEDVTTFEQLIDEAVKGRKFGLSKRLDDTLRTITGRELLGYLANRNILPKYGFPVDTVELRTLHATDPVGRQLELARDLSLAVYEYAPGNEVVAGGKVWTSIGLRKLPERELDHYSYRICQTCKRFQCGRQLDTAEVCPSCQDSFGAIGNLVLPEYGFIASRDTREVGSAPPERRWWSGSRNSDLLTRCSTPPTLPPSGVVTPRFG
jgi:hypothetical protein